MKNIKNIFTHDLRKLGSSVVVIITIVGLCIVPCLYAWFNIFSNWAPYESEATGRILVAVANEDQDANMLGLNINVGEMIVEALDANEDIGWVFTDTAEEAIEGVRASDYYAALVIPESFSRDLLSFITGDFDNPTLYYYENEKKNAVAPKITGKAEETVRKEVNETFIATLAKYIAEAATAADAAGVDPSMVFGDLADQLDLLGGRLDSAVAIVNASISLSQAAGELMSISDSLIDDSEDTIAVGQDFLDVMAEGIPEEGIDIEESLHNEVRELTDNMNKVSSDFDSIMEDMDLYNRFVTGTLDTRTELVRNMSDSAEKVAGNLDDLGLTTLGDQFRNASGDLLDFSTRMGDLEEATPENWEEIQQQLSDLRERADSITNGLFKIEINATETPEKKFNEAIKQARTAVIDVRNSLDGTYDNLELMVDLLDGYDKSLADLEKGLSKTTASILSMQTGLHALADLFDTIADSELFEDVNSLLVDDTEVVASYLGSPMKMDTVKVYPVSEYGSQMAPFYTVLAQWVGALLTAVLIKASVKKRDDLVNLRLHQRFFGRYLLFALIGIAQALIVSLGDLIYVGIQCEHPALFVLAACVNGLVFMMINFALVFSLDNVGLALGVIILLMQVAGSGGTYPIEVLPDIFKTLYPIMPFRYSMMAMRECIAGMYDSVYLHSILIMLLYGLIFIVLGLLLYYPALRLNKLIAESKKKSDIMV